MTPASNSKTIYGALVAAPRQSAAIISPQKMPRSDEISDKTPRIYCLHFNHLPHLHITAHL
jgi:hypothetical protein